jgi:hypothetical protein
MPGKFYNTKQAARFLQCSTSKLEKLRVYGGGPRYFQVKPRAQVLYYEDDLVAWSMTRPCRSTSDGNLAMTGGADHV